MSNFTWIERGFVPILMHNTKPIWIVFYEAHKGIRAAFYQAYKAIHPVPKGRNAWSIDNRRVGDEDGFETLEAAMAAVEAA